MSEQIDCWATRPLGELCDVSRGITYGIVKVGNFVPGGMPVIRGGDIRDNRSFTIEISEFHGRLASSSNARSCGAVKLF